ncbi:hypothetical protein BC332_12733 [Capsicum chinense]|nr:hypothetical protein BC332_12733 [Capsicum chinense]
MPFFLTLQFVQTLLDPKVVDGIKMELFGATAITRKTILEGGANDAPLTVFETTSHYDYDHNGCTDFSPDFSASSEFSLCKCQDCKVKHDGVINVINTLTASVKEMTSKRGVIPSKRISYPHTSLEIKAAKMRRKDTSKASSIIRKSKITMPLSLSCTEVQYARTIGEQHGLKKVDVTVEEHNITVDNPSTASKDEKVKPHIDVIIYYLRKKAKLQIQEQYRYTMGNYLYKFYINNAYDRYCQQQPKVSRKEECLINIIKGFSIPTGLPWHLIDEVYIPINCGDEVHWVLAIVVLKERDCGPFVATYAKYLRDGLQVPNDSLDAGLLRKRYDALLWKYGEAKIQKPYTTYVKDPRQPKPNSVAPDEEQLVHID